MCEVLERALKNLISGLISRQSSERTAAQQLLSAGWDFNPGEMPPQKTLARAIAAGHAGVLEYMGQPHRGSCHVPHDHAVHRYCRHGAWHLRNAVKLPWQRSAHAWWLEQVCPCPLRIVVSEFHPASAADEMRRTLEPAMNEWLGSYIAQQPACQCIPLLRLGSVLGEQGLPVEVMAVLYHDQATCAVPSEPIVTRVDARSMEAES